MATAATVEENVPVTMRINNSIINALKDKAREISFENGAEITYVDLIREAVNKHYLIDLPEQPRPAWENEADLEFFSDTREFWTPTRMRAFEQTERGKMLQNCIDTNNYTEFVALLNRVATKWLRKNSKGRQMLVNDDDVKPTEFYQIWRDLMSIAHVSPRRGTLSENIMEVEQLASPTLTIGTNNRIRKQEISVVSLQMLCCAMATAFCKEYESQVFDAFYAAAISRHYQIYKTEWLDVDAFCHAFQNIAQHGLIPSQIVMSMSDYVWIHSFGPNLLKSLPLKLALETKNYGSIMGVPVHASVRARTGKILVSAPSHHVGVSFCRSRPTVKHQSDVASESEKFVLSGDYGFVVVNDYAIAVIDLKQKESAEEQPNKKE